MGREGVPRRSATEYVFALSSSPYCGNTIIIRRVFLLHYSRVAQHLCVICFTVLCYSSELSEFHAYNAILTSG